MHVLMVAAENDALPGAKVGGIADVVRDLPIALSARQVEVSVLVPSYGVLHETSDSTQLGEFSVQFRGDYLTVSLWQLFLPDADPQVKQYVLHSAAFAPRTPGEIYCNDPPQRPFASDASKFAFFSAAVAETIKREAFKTIDTIHLHDWHVAWLLLLRAYDPEFSALQQTRCVYTIHNLALQGVRPLREDPSSLEEWFPDLQYEESLVIDPRWPDCVNPMALAIRLADAVNTVSPSYARDILKPDAIAESGFHGGEGLHQDLLNADQQGRLHGILNGCEYPEALSKRSWPTLLKTLREEALSMAVGSDATVNKTHNKITSIYLLNILSRSHAPAW